MFHHAAIPSVPRSVKEPLLVASNRADGDAQPARGGTAGGRPAICFRRVEQRLRRDDELPKHEEMMPHR